MLNPRPLPVCLVAHDDHWFLRETLRSYASAGPATVFVSTRAWNGRQGRWDLCASEAVAAGAEVIVGDWPDESLHRQIALAEMKKRGHRHVLLPDGDEIASPELLESLVRLAKADAAETLKKAASSAAARNSAESVTTARKKKAVRAVMARASLSAVQTVRIAVRTAGIRTMISSVRKAAASRARKVRSIPVRAAIITTVRPAATAAIKGTATAAIKGTATAVLKSRSKNAKTVLPLTRMPTKRPASKANNAQKVDSENRSRRNSSTRVTAPKVVSRNLSVRMVIALSVPKETLKSLSSVMTATATVLSALPKIAPSAKKAVLKNRSIVTVIARNAARAIKETAMAVSRSRSKNVKMVKAVPLIAPTARNVPKVVLKSRSQKRVKNPAVNALPSVRMAVSVPKAMRPVLRNALTKRYKIIKIPASSGDFYGSRLIF